MKMNLKALASLALVSTVTLGYAQTTASTSASTHRTPRKVHRKVEHRPTVESQIEELRQQMQQQSTQINTLQQQLTERETELQQAQQAAQQAQSAAQQAQAAANQQQQQLTDNAQAVTALQSSVSDIKSNTQSIVSTIQDQQTQVKKMVEHPDEIHYKGVTLSPKGSFLAAETVWRQGATGGGINTAFTGIPLDNSAASNISEFYGSGRQSRIALKATGKAGDMRLSGYYEADWLSAGTTSNNNQSNSYTMRQRQLWGQATMASGWQFTGGQMWSLTTETTHGLDNGTEILPGTIDPQYVAGFVWNRQYGFRATKDFGNKFWIGASAENDQLLVGGNSLPTNEIVGSNGTGGGLYDNQATYSYNLAPELVAKIAMEPGWGHWEVFGVSRFFHERIYPTGGTPYNDSTVAGGIGASMRAPIATKKLTFGLKGLYGDGTGRMGSSTIEDATLRPNGQLAVLHTFSALSTLEANAGKRLMVYLNYGGDYVGRTYFGTTGEGYGSPYNVMSGCTVETNPAAGPNDSSAPTAPSNCKGNTKDVQEFTLGDWYTFYDGPAGRLRFGLQYARFERDLWSGLTSAANPGGAAKGTDNMFWTSFRYYLP